MKKINYVICLVTLISCFSTSTVLASDGINAESVTKMIDDTMKEADVPGLSMVVIIENQSYFYNYGFSNIKEQTKTTSETYYELGSMSKAFTALGILLLEDEGKLSLEDPVSQYLPWLKFSYNEESGIVLNDKQSYTNEMTIGNLLYHTSGIPYNSINCIPEGISDDMLEKTVATLNYMELDFPPGKMFQYVTINYDVLGLIIQTISGQTYESFIYENVLQPLKLNQTFLSYDDIEVKGELATGYKPAFFNAQAYKAPRYRGNTPAGYIISNAQDMERWMRIQAELEPVSEQFKRIILKSHQGDNSVISHGNLYYGAGWDVQKYGNLIQHGGNNPNYSSMIIIKPEISVCILTNKNSNAAEFLAQNIINMYEGKELSLYQVDYYHIIDRIFSILSICSFIIIVFLAILLLKVIFDITRKKRTLCRVSKIKIIGIFILNLDIVGIIWRICNMPNYIQQEMSWYIIRVWGSVSVTVGCVSVCLTCILINLLISVLLIYKKSHSYKVFSGR